MEEKQLDFNAPLLSVRRFTASSDSRLEESKRREKLQKRAFPSCRSEVKSGPVRNAGAVPFQWEQSPGRPKDGSVLHSGTPEKPPILPKLPPGRVLNYRKSSLAKHVDKESEASTQTRERQPDKLMSCPDPTSSGGNVISLEIPKLGVKEEDPDSDDCDDEAFSDALDTLSQTDSQFMNCSLSDLSAFDGPVSRYSGKLLTDSRARDFMINRFLPAAVAMASETRHCPLRKQSVVREPEKPVNGSRKSLPYQCRPHTVPPLAYDVDTKDSENEDDDYDDSGNMTAKVCGLLPRFCLKNSLCLLNPVPGMKVRNSIPLSLVNHKLHGHIGSVPSQYTDTIHENIWEAVFDHKLAHVKEPPEALEDESKLTSESNRLTYWSDSQTLDGSSPYRRSTGDGISPYRNGRPCSPFHEGVGFLGMPKLGKNLKSDGIYMHGKGRNDYRETSSQESSKHGSSAGSPAVEKSLYVDSFKMLGTLNSTSSSSDNNSSQKEVDVHLEAETMQKSLVLTTDADSSNRIKPSKEQGLLQNTLTEIVEVNHSSGNMGSPVGRQKNKREVLRRDDALDQEITSLEFSRALINDNLNLNDIKHSKEKDEGNGCATCLQSPLPPPLPKSPSESWLWRTLPAVSSTNPSHRPYLGIQFRSMKHVVKSSSQDPKWETMVKTASIHHGHSRFSEELKTPVSKQPMG